MIYAIRAQGTEFIKFGRAKSVGKRLRELDVANPHDLHILAVADWPDETESTIHALLQDCHQKGEWFKDSTRSQSIIQLMLDKNKGLEKIQKQLRVERTAQGIPSRPRARDSAVDQAVVPWWQLVAMDAFAQVVREKYGIATKEEKA